MITETYGWGYIMEPTDLWIENEKESVVYCIESNEDGDAELLTYNDFGKLIAVTQVIKKD